MILLTPPFGDIAVFFEVLGDRDEHTWWESEIEDSVALLGLVAGLDVLKALIQLVKSGTILVAASEIR